ncbi:hypothetical protein SCANM63S_09536 [Streptomyces canarius]
MSGKYMPEAPGPPGLKTRAPCRGTLRLLLRGSLWVAWARLTVSRIRLPFGCA